MIVNGIFEPHDFILKNSISIYNFFHSHFNFFQQVLEKLDPIWTVSLFLKQGVRRTGLPGDGTVLSTNYCHRETSWLHQLLVIQTLLYFGQIHFHQCMNVNTTV